MIFKERKVLVLILFGILILSACSGGNETENRVYQVKEAKKFLKPEIHFKGSIVFQSDFDGDNEIYVITMEGLEKITDNTWDDEYPVWSPDGKKIAFSANPKENYDIFTMDADGSNRQRITSSSLPEETPAWFPDNKTIAYAKKIGGGFRSKSFLFMMNTRTKKGQRIIPDYDRTHIIPWISPDGSWLTFTGKRTLGWDVAVCDLESKNTEFIERGGKSCRGRFSPDGKKIAYVCSRADGKGDIWLMNPDGSQKTRLTKRDETYDYFPSWSPDGDYIVFNSSQKHDHIGKLLIVKVKTAEVYFVFDSPGNDVYPDWK